MVNGFRIARMEDGSEVHVGATVFGSQPEPHILIGVTADGALIRVIAGRVERQVSPQQFHLMVLSAG